MTKVPLSRALVTITVSVAVTVTTAFLAWQAYGYSLIRRASDPSYQLFAIVQTGPEKEALKSSYLAELLGLSADKPVNLYAFNNSEARQRLLKSPLIKEASVTTFLPGTVYVDYTARKPAAYIRDYSNTAVDAEGVLIPTDPFFTPKRLPQIFLGLPNVTRVWGCSAQGTRLTLANAVRDCVEKTLPTESTTIKLIDVSLCEAASCGQREIVLTLEERRIVQDGERLTEYLQPVLLRLNPLRYREALADYATLRKHLETQPLPSANSLLAMRTVDLRLPQVAYLSN